MKIAVNTRLLIKGKLEGIGVFTKAYFEEITKSHPEHEFYFFFDRPPHKSFIFSKNITPIILSPSARHPILFIIWFEWLVRRALKKYKIDLFISPDGFLSLLSKTKQCAVVHDVSFKVFPKLLPFSVRLYYSFFFSRFIKKADFIFTGSNFSKNEIIKYYNTNPKKIKVVSYGVSSIFKPTAENKQKLIRQKITNGIPYFIYVGALQPRKNINRLIQAFDLFKKNSNANYKLVIIGEKKWWSKKSNENIKNIDCKNEIIFLGRQTSKELVGILGSATALIYVSLYEGFGLPTLEAMKTKIPVITSNNSSMKEITENASILVNPLDIKDIANGLLKLSQNKKLREKLVEKGNKKVLKYTWEKGIKIFWEEIEKRYVKNATK